MTLEEARRILDTTRFWHDIVGFVHCPQCKAYGRFVTYAIRHEDDCRYAEARRVLRESEAA